MGTHDLTTMYTSKAVEYLIAVSYVLLFIPFWRFVNGGRTVRERAVQPAVARPQFVSDWFELPARLFFHPGHAWARMDGADAVTIGIDDFARKLVGNVSALNLPKPGDSLSQGEAAWSLVAHSKTIGMLSPVNGTVTAVNSEALASPDLVQRDPYGAGWLLKVRSPNLATNLHHLLSGRLARQWLDGVASSLRVRVGAELGLVYEDGGALIDGLAHGLDPERWDLIAREFLLTDGGGHRA